MTRQFKVWLDSGANIHSCNKQTITLGDLGLTDGEWDAMTDDEKESAMRDVAFNQSEWGFSEITDETETDD